MNKRICITLAVVFALAIFGQFGYSIYTKTIDKSSYTDWISAVCNIIMAGATVAAVVAAKNYIAQFTAQEGFKIAIELVNDNIMILNRYQYGVNNFINLADDLEKFNKKPPRKENITSLSKKQKRPRDVHNSI